MTYQTRNIGIAAVLAVAAAILTAYFVKTAQDSAESGGVLTKVLVAAGDIVAGTPGSNLESGKLEVREVPRDSVVPGAVASPDQVANLVTADTILRGEQITVRQFAPLGAQGVLAHLTGNMRALQVPGTQHQLLAGTLKEGDHVDVIASVKVTPAGASAASDERAVSRVVLRNLLVLSAPADPENDGGISSSVAPTLSATLAVTDRQSQKLFWVMTNSQWSLQLRPIDNPKDSPESVDSSSTVLADGLGSSQRYALATGR